MPRPSKPLTDAAIQAAIRASQKKPGRLKLTDGDGMYLLIDPPRRPAWRLKYYVAGREKLISLGTYPVVTLSAAREARLSARRLVAGGTDPSAQRKAEKAKRVDTFRAVGDEWLSRQSKVLAAETISILRSRLESTLHPAFGPRPISSITAADLLPVLRRLENQGKVETAHRVKALYGRVARYAIATGRAERDVSADLRGALTPVQTQHFAALIAPKRVGELLRAIDGYHGQPSVEYALKIAPLVFVRPGELRGAEWQEFSDLGGRERTWCIPAARMKMGRDHLVPLSWQVVKLLRQLAPLTGGGRLLFPGLRTPSRPISDNALNAALRRMDYGRKEMVAHGFRAMARTMLQDELRYPVGLIRRQLAHLIITDETDRAYDRASQLPERRKMMQEWADYLDELKTQKARK